MTKKRNFWDKFEDTMDSLGDFIDETVDKATSGIDMGNGSSYSVQTTSMNGKVIKTVTRNGTTTMTINSEEVVPKKYADDLYSALETTAKSIPVEQMPAKAVKAINRSTKAYDNYRKGKK